MSGEAVTTWTAADTETVALAVRSAPGGSAGPDPPSATPLRRSLLASVGGASVDAPGDGGSCSPPRSRPSSPRASVCTWQTASAAMVNDAKTLASSPAWSATSGHQVAFEVSA